MITQTSRKPFAVYAIQVLLILQLFLGVVAAAFFVITAGAAEQYWALGQDVNSPEYQEGLSRSHAAVGIMTALSAALAIHAITALALNWFRLRAARWYWAVFALVGFVSSLMRAVVMLPQIGNFSTTQILGIGAMALWL